MNGQMMFLVLVGLAAAILHYALPKTRPLADYLWLAACVVFLLTASGKLAWSM